ncbi:Dam family site-specific DNA-(adenine-N6)-methyltransferase [Neptunicella marina]|uniref:Site-specific DNA-methyltransferase (adenine-specific) n=1 Tax=Neptunicella marina TaxID=2125989 RepID=A0A8J6IVV8_9ALTE|nr:Dam family site-specific DNA-(adenine-N6)-methyltransferase [Neptunicella marina]MBC3767611.1 Dam family site-specific DNA-(adenine-N6)-methyltransferase [Neptunicella marina]
MKNNNSRSFLKWAGGKYALMDSIRSLLPEGNSLIEPFVGAGSVFLNTAYDKYVLNDINPDLINLYQHLKKTPEKLIHDAQTYFISANNDAAKYYAIRAEFNQSKDSYYRSVLFLYLNRHCYNGLCRYNLSGGFNVPFGRYKKPYFPEKEMLFFAEKAQKAVFSCQSYDTVINKAKKGSVIYCDPPYAPINQTSNFTSYSAFAFGIPEQRNLAELCYQVAKRKGISILLSNHDTELTRQLYQHAAITPLLVSRSISQKGHKRQKVGELLAMYQLTQG